ncbi:MAG: PhoX family protein [Acidobacteria bacterium]|nr:PhoX family protein [Acidobacteriota bacterium]
MTTLNRRAFLGVTPLAVGGALQTFAAINARYRPGRLISSHGAAGYGGLTPTKSRNTGETIITLPEGFEYNVIGKTGAKMSDGNPTPAAHDGMATFKVNNELRLVRNHEINGGIGRDGAAFGDAALAYDPKAGGGVTTLIIDPKTREIVKDFVSLNGTLQNCAGGPTPWGSWISCEETTLGKSQGKDDRGRERGGFSQQHGYCFEVIAGANGAVKPTPLAAMGRFVHEAIAVDARTGVVYLTEDRGAAGFYRFIPKRQGKLSEGGKLQMLAIAGRRQIDLRTGQKAGESLNVNWVDINEPDPPDAENSVDAVYRQGFALGAATFARLEGCWYGGDSIFFTATSGGDKRLGQVWQYMPQGKDKGKLKLIFESPEEAVLDMPDNLCVSPNGGLIVCEDGKNEQYVRGLTREGQIFDVAKNILPGSEGREFAGATFSPDGQTLFINIQTPGMTLAIWGPWERGAL